MKLLALILFKGIHKGFSFRVVGHPVTHSLSPQIHRKFAEKLSLKIDYQIQELPLEGFESGIKNLLAEGVQGFSVTLPFKQKAYAMAEVLTTRALRAQSVNTLFLRDGKLHGDNTDGAGFFNNIIKNQYVILNHPRVLILGSGGAALGILGPLLDAGASVSIFSRSPLKADHPLRLFDLDRPNFSEASVLNFLSFSSNLSALSDSSSSSSSSEIFDLVINATPVQWQCLEDQENSKHLWSCGWVGPETVGYDLSYCREKNDQTFFSQWILNQGAKRAVDGLGMLVEQAALQFEIFMGVPVPQALIDEVINDFKMILK